MASLLDLIRKQITGEMSDAYLGAPQYLGTSRNTIDNLISPQSVRNFPANMNVAVNQSPRSANYVAPNPQNIGILSGMGDQLNAMSDTQRMMEQNYDLNPSIPYSTNLQGQGSPYNPIRNRQEDVINPANNFSLYADTVNSNVNRDLERDSMEDTLIRKNTYKDPIVDRDTERDAMERTLYDNTMQNLNQYQRDMAEIDAAADQVRMMEENNELDPAQQFLGALPTDDDLLTDEFKQGFGKVTEEGESKPRNIEEALVKEYEKEAEGILGVDSDTWLNLATAFNTMRLDPDDSLITAIKSIRESKKNKNSRQAVIGQMEGYKNAVQNPEQKARLEALISIAKAGYGDPEQLVDKAFKVFQPYNDVFMEKNATKIYEANEKLVQGRAQTLNTLEREKQIQSYLDSGDLNVGFLGSARNELSRAFGFFGNDEERKKASDTQYVDALLGGQVFGAIRDLGIGARGLDTPAEREFLRQVMSGTIDQEPETLRRLSELRQKLAIRQAQNFNKKLKEGYFKNYESAHGVKLQPIELTPEMEAMGAPDYKISSIEDRSWEGKVKGSSSSDDNVKDIKDY